jgi:hypothetical protein
MKGWQIDKGNLSGRWTEGLMEGWMNRLPFFGTWDYSNHISLPSSSGCEHRVGSYLSHHSLRLQDNACWPGRRLSCHLASVWEGAAVIAALVTGGSGSAEACH